MEILSFIFYVQSECCVIGFFSSAWIGLKKFKKS